MDQTLKTNKIIPLVTVLIPVFNAERHLKEAIDSILNQTYNNLEILIINDGSYDSSEDIILQYKDPRIKYIKNEKNIKLIKTLNKGLELATGEFIARMDADDIAAPNRIQFQIDNCIDNNNEINSVFAIYIKEDGKIHSKREFYCTQPNSIIFTAFFDSPLLHPGVLASTKLMRKYKYIDNDSSLAIEDYDLWTRMLADGVKLNIIPKYLMYYRRNSQGESTKLRTVQAKNHLQLSKTFCSTFLKKEIDINTMAILTKQDFSNIQFNNVLKSWSDLTEFYKHFEKVQKLSKIEQYEIKNWINIRKLEITLIVLIKAPILTKLKGLLLFFKIDLFRFKHIDYFKNLISIVFMRNRNCNV